VVGISGRGIRDVDAEPDGDAPCRRLLAKEKLLQAA
jgi:hypothetical protein